MSSLRRRLILWVCISMSAFLQLASAHVDRPTRTLSNLNASLQGETNTSRRYKAFAVQADKEGYHQVAKLFRAVSRSEEVHQRNEEAAVKEMGSSIYPFSPVAVHVGTTKENLESITRFEKQENAEMYPEFIRQAQRDRARAAVQAFTSARDAELHHATLFEEALVNLGRNEKMDYYVSMKTGALVEKFPTSRAPASFTKHGEEFIKVE